MPVHFSEDQVVEATGARRVQGSAGGPFQVVCTDTRQLTPGCLFVALIGERYDAHDFLKDAPGKGAAGAVVQKGIALPELPADFVVFEVEDTLTALGALARHHRRRFKQPVGAVGGSNGKTTTKEMVGAILATRGSALKTEGNFNNEIGVPLTLFRLGEEHVAAVVEMGMNHPGEMTRLAQICEPDAALLTVIQPEHLEGLGSLQGVADAEGELFAALPPEATAVVNLDDPLLPAQAMRSAAKHLTFGKEPTAAVRLLHVVPRGKAGQTVTIGVDGRELEFQLNFVGEHNALNATGAFALCLALGYSPDECARGLEQARPYARRLNLIDAPHGVLVVDDCYNANPASMGAALDTLQSLVTGGGRRFAVLGDMLELGPGEYEEHEKLGQQATSKVDVLALFGPRSQLGHQAAVSLMGERTRHFIEVPALLEWLTPQLRAGDVVLVKGSRGMRLERVVQALTGTQAPGGAH